MALTQHQAGTQHQPPRVASPSLPAHGDARTLLGGKEAFQQPPPARTVPDVQEPAAQLLVFVKSGKNIPEC